MNVILRKSRRLQAAIASLALLQCAVVLGAGKPILQPGAFQVASALQQLSEGRPASEKVGKPIFEPIPYSTWESQAWETKPSEQNTIASELTVCGDRYVPLWPGVGAHNGPLVVYDDGLVGPRAYSTYEYRRGDRDVFRVVRLEGNEWVFLPGVFLRSGNSSISNTDAHASSLAVFDGGNGPELYVAGYFDFVDSLQAGMIARWDGRSWKAVGLSLNNAVRTLEIRDTVDGQRLSAAGQFSRADHFVPWHGVDLSITTSFADWDGVAWAAAAPLASAAPVPSVDTPLFNGEFFRVEAGVVEKWDGSAWAPTVQPPVSGIGGSLVVHDQGAGERLWVQGADPGAGNISIGKLFSFDGTAWLQEGVDLDPTLSGSDSESVGHLTSYDDGTSRILVAKRIGRTFFSDGSLQSYTFFDYARWDGNVWQTMSSLNGASLESIQTRAADGPFGPDLQILDLHGDGSPELLALDRNGESWWWDGTLFLPIVRPELLVAEVVEAYPDTGGESVYVGGLFYSAGATQFSFAKWDGSALSYAPGGLDGRVNALYRSAVGGGQLWASGDLTLQSANLLAARWDGSQWQQADAGLPAQIDQFEDFAGDVYALANDMLYRWDGTSAWIGLGAPGAGGRFASMKPFDSGSGLRLVVVGDFSSVEGVAAQNAAEFDPALGWAPFIDSPWTFTGDIAIRNQGQPTETLVASSVWLLNGAWTTATPYIPSGPNNTVVNVLFNDPTLGDSVYVGGSFGNHTTNVVPWGSQFFQPLSGGGVTDLAALQNAADPTLIIAGGFNIADDVRADSLVYWVQTSGCAPRPSLTVNQPSDNSLVTSSPIPVVGSVGEPSKVTVNGRVLPMNALQFSGLQPLGEGQNDLVIEATSELGRERTRSRTVFLDQVPPQAVLAVPPDGSVVPAATPSFELLVSDEVAGVDANATLVRVDGTSVSASCGLVASRMSCALQTSLADGVRSVEVTVVDSAGNAGLPLTFDLIIDAGAGVTTTSVVGRVVDGVGVVAGARVLLLGAGDPVDAVSAVDGTFSFSGVDVGIGGLLSVVASTGPSSSPVLGVALNLAPVLGAITDAGDVMISATCDPTFVPVSSGAGGVGFTTSSHLRAATIFDDGTGPALYVAGNFSQIGGVDANSIAKWDGQSWSSVGGGVAGVVYSMKVVDDGVRPALIVGGSFLSVDGGLAAVRVARWDGAWSALGSGIGPNALGQDFILALEEFDDGSGKQLYAAGWFNSSGTAPFYRWDGIAWQDVGAPALNAGVRALKAFDDGSGPALYVGGDFTGATGIALRHLARWDGAAWSDVGFGTAGRVHALEVHDDGAGPQLFVGGNFGQAGRTSVGNSSVVRWDGRDLRPVGDRVRPSFGVTFALQSRTINGVSEFFALETSSTSTLLRWNGVEWTEFDLGVPNVAFGSSSDVGALAAGALNGREQLFFAGNAFPLTPLPTEVGVFEAGNVSPLLRGLDGEVTAFTIGGTGRKDLIAGGAFSASGSGPAAGVARFDGRSWLPMGPGFDDLVLALHQDAAGSLYAAGDFTTSGATSVSRVALWNGSSWDALGTGADGTVRALASHDDGSGNALYAGGTFANAGGFVAPSVARWSGSSWSSVGSGMDGPVSVLLEFDDGSGTSLFAGGSFSTAGGSSAANIARWDGAAWQQLGSGLNGEVLTLAVFDDGSGPALFAGGFFTSAGGVGARGVAKWDGASWTSTGFTAAGRVEALEVFDDGTGEKLVATGNFTLPGNRIAAWDGSSWGGLGSGLDDAGYALQAFVLDGVPALFIGGAFKQAGGDEAAFLAAWQRSLTCADTTAPLINITSPAHNGFLAPYGTVDLSYSDPGISSGLDLTSLQFTVGGSPASFTCQTSPTTASCIPDVALAESSQVISVTIADLAGNVGTNPTHVVTVDGQDPTLAITAPLDGDVVQTSTPTLLLTHSDAVSGIDTGAFDLQLSAGLGAWSCNLFTGTSDCTPDNPVPDGSYSIRASVADNVGNTAEQWTFFRVDTVAPVVSFVAPLDGAMLQSAFPVLQLDIQDAGGIDPATLVVEANSVQIGVDCQFGLPSVVCTPQVALAQGLTTLTVSVTDVANRTSSTSITVDIQPSPPLVQFLYPLAGSTVNTETPQLQLNLEARAGPITTSSLQVFNNGVLLTPAPACSFNLPQANCTLSAPLPEGVANLSATVMDQVNLTSQPGMVSFTVDVLAPEVAFTSPTPSAVVANQPHFELSLIADGAPINTASLAITAGGNPVPVSCVFALPAAACDVQSPQPDGPTTFIATVSDTNGATGTAQLSLVLDANAPLDSSPPVLTIAKPDVVSGYTVGQAIRVLFGDNGTGVDPNTLEIEFDGQQISANCTACSIYADCTPSGVLPPSVTAIGASVADHAGNRSPLFVLDFSASPPVDVTPPVITLLSPAQGITLTQAQQQIVGVLSEPATLTIGGSSATVNSSNRFDHPFTFSSGSNSVVIEATDAAGNVGQVTLSATLDDIVPQPVNAGLITVSAVVGGLTTVNGAPGAVTVNEPNLTVALTNRFSGILQTVAVAADGSFGAMLPAQGGDSLLVAVADPPGNVSSQRGFLVPGSPTLPPDPATGAPTPTGDLWASVGYLIEGANPVQTGVVPGTIEPRRTAVLRGRLVDVNGVPLSGVSVSVKGNPEYGRTVSRGDGFYDLVVNGGGPITLQFNSSSHLTAHRAVKPQWQDFKILKDVTLIELDPQTTAVDLAQPGVKVAQGSMISDSDGQRQTTLFFMPGTQAQAEYAAGAPETLSNLTVRATEYTVGASGPSAMPATLPPSSAYTYAVELSVDEAEAQGATSVVFDQPVPVYVDNFLNFPPGTVVPAAYYDREEKRWVPSQDGVVIELLSPSGGFAELDVDGSGNPADAATLAALGVTDTERQQLALTYSVGDELWRVPVTHFSPHDFNLPAAPPFEDDQIPDEEAPEVGDENNKPDPCDEYGSIIECENQVLGEIIGISGTGFTLNYRSNRAPGYRLGRELRIPTITGAVPQDLLDFDLEISVAGQQFSQTLLRGDTEWNYEWDGRDGNGNLVTGRRPFEVRIGYNYPADYQNVPEGCQSCFGLPGTGPITADPARNRLTLWQTHRGFIGNLDAKDAFDLGGWSLNVHHVYDPREGILYLGNGSYRKPETQVINRVAGSGATQASGGGQTPGGGAGDGGPATQAGIQRPDDLVAEADGGYLISDPVNCRVRRVDSSGTITTVAGTVCPPGIPPWVTDIKDNGPADQAVLGTGVRIEEGPDGDLYILDPNHYSLRKVDAQGVITTVAGYNQRGGALPDPSLQPGLQAEFIMNDFAFGVSGEIYTLNPIGGTFGTYSIDKVDLLAGTRVNRFAAGARIPLGEEDGSFINGGNKGLASELPLWRASAIAVSSVGTIYVADSEYDVVWGISSVGTYWRVAGFFDGTTTEGYTGDGGPGHLAQLNEPFGLSLDAEGNLYIADRGNHVVRKVDSAGIITTVAGTGAPGNAADVEAAMEAELDEPSAVAAESTGAVLVADTRNDAVRRVQTPTSRFVVLGQEIRVASEDGRVVYVFNGNGRHLRTEHADTAVVLHSFGYDPEGRLISITDAYSRATVVERDSAGEVTGIVAPFGQRTDLELSGSGRYLTRATNPAGGRINLQYGSDGLLTQFEDPEGNRSAFQYHSNGTLYRDTDPAQGFTQLERSTLPDGVRVTKTTALGRTRHYDITDEAGVKKTTVTHEDGSTTVLSVHPDGSREAQHADGTVAVLKTGSDVRFGPQAPTTSEITITTPAGLSSVMSFSRDLVRDPLGNPRRLTSTAVSNGRIATEVTDFLAGTITKTSPEGRTSKTYYDSFGRPTRLEHPGLHPVLYSYDALGRLSTESQGSRTTIYAYDSSTGFLESVTDPLGRTISYTHDSAGRVVSLTLPDSTTVGVGYDRNGRVVSLSPPSRPAHEFSWNSRRLPTSYTAPAAAGGSPITTFQYNLDRQVTQADLPDGRQVLMDFYPASGRLRTVTTPRGDYSYAYSSGTGLLSSVTGPDGGAIAFGYDGSLPVLTTWSGEVSGSVGLAYDNGLRVVEERVNGGQQITFSHSQDGLLERAGQLSLTHDPSSGFLRTSQLLATSEDFQYSLYGDVSEYSASYGGAALFNVVYTRDDGDRVTSKVETVQGVPTTYGYSYDAAGRLDTVTKNGTVVADYDYDSNGNRTSWFDEIETAGIVASYDEQDRLLGAGLESFSYNALGQLESRSAGGQTVAYSYDTQANLRSVSLPTGITIDYVIDPSGRRIGKKVNGVLSKGWLYSGELTPVAELDPNGTVTRRFVYATSDTVPDYMSDGGDLFRFVRDHLGSVRLVVNAASGAVAQRIDYDAFGRVTLDTNPGFQPFGFAGGLYDHQTGLVRFGARDYDPAVGRWTSKDPIGFEGGDTNLYAYVRSDPVNETDPTGTYFWAAITAAVTINEIVEVGKAWWAGCISTGQAMTRLVWILVEAALPVKAFKAAAGAAVFVARRISALVASGVRRAAGAAGKAKRWASVIYTAGRLYASRPSGWKLGFSRNRGGLMFFDPKNTHLYIRIMPGDPLSKFPNSRNPYVRIQRHGHPYDVNGRQLPTDQRPDAHIPVADFKWLPDGFFE